MIFQFGVIIISFIIILFGAPIAIKRIFKYDLKKYIWAILLGMTLGVVTKKLIRPKAYWYFSQVFPSFWHTKLGYGLLFGVAAGLIDEFLRYLILRTIFFYKRKWISGSRGSVAFGIGQGWTTGFLAWGLFLIQLIEAFFEGSLESYGVTFSYLIFGLSEVIFSFFLYIGMTFVIKYGLKVHKCARWVIAAIFYHSVAVMLMYYIEYLIGLPALVAQLAFGIMSVGAYIGGHRMLRKLRHCR